MPIQVIWGNDLNACNIEIENIINMYVSKSWANLNVSKLNGDDSEQVFKALDEIHTPALGGGSRIVLVRNNPLFNSKNDTLNDKFIRECKNIPEQNYLILHNNQKPDARIKTTKSIKELVKIGKANESFFNVPDIWDLEGQIIFLQRTAESMNIQLDRNASIELIDSIGFESTKIINELEKAKLYLLAKNQDNKSQVILKRDDVKEIFNEHQSNIFKIIDSLIEQNISQSLIEINSLLNKGEPPLRLTAGLISQIRMHTIVLILANEKDLSIISKLANISNPKRIFYIRKKIKNCSPKFLIDIMIKLLNIESWIKKGNDPSNVFKENLITLT